MQSTPPAANPERPASCKNPLRSPTSKNHQPECAAIQIESATRNAREAAEKFADDSGSELGKIRQAQQGLFSISDRDSTTPYIKRIRVVSTIEYTLSD